MSRLSRYTQKLFGTSATNNQMAEFGSLANGTPLRYSGSTITPAIVQTLSNYLGGWFSAILGSNAPAIEDMNALCYLFSYQLGYLMQSGVAEWDAATTYYIGQIVNDGSGNLYSSKTNTNANNAVTDATNWQKVVGSTSPTVQKFTSGSGTYTTPAGVRYIRVVAVGAGAGGQGGGGGGGTGGTGGNTTFGTSLIAANGAVANVGGSASLGSGPLGVAYNGMNGNGNQNNNGTGAVLVPGSGGSTPYGGAGTATWETAGGNAQNNSGSGGGGGSGQDIQGIGGGAGGYVNALIVSPAPTYAYTVGAGGAGGTAGIGVSPNAGGNGAAGIILVEEYYQ